MRRYIIILFLISFCIIRLFSQVYNNPVFDRCDVPAFRVEKIEITKDTTYLHCQYSATSGSWANISHETFVYDQLTKKKYPLLRCSGLPYSPQKKTFMYDENCKLLLCFPSVNSISKIDLIEDESNKAFNIYGIDISAQYETSYKESEVNRFNNMASFYESAGDTIKALQYKEKEIEATKYVYGIKSEPLIVSLLNASVMYDKYGYYEQAISIGKQEGLIHAELWGTSDWKYALYLRTLGQFYSHARRYDLSVNEFEKSISLFELIHVIDNEYALALYFAAGDYYELGDIEKALICQKKSIQVRRRLGSADDYINELYNILLTGHNEATQERMQMVKDELSNLPNFVGPSSLLIGRIYKQLASMYSLMNDNKNAIEYCDKALFVMESNGYNNNEDYAELLGLKCKYQQRSGIKDDAIFSGTTAKQLYESLGIRSLKYAELLGDLAWAYSLTLNFENSVQLLIQAASIYENAKDWLSLAETYNGVSHFLQCAEKLDVAEQYIKKAISVLDNHNNAEQYLIDAVEQTGNSEINNPFALVTINRRINTNKSNMFQTLAVICQKQGKIGQALKYQKVCCDISKDMGDFERYSLDLIRMAQIYWISGNLKDAEACCEQAIKLSINKYPDILSFAKIQLSIIKGELNKYHEPLIEGKEALLVSNDVGNLDTTDQHLLATFALAYHNYMNGDYENAEKSYGLCLDSLQTKIILELTGMNSKQKQRLWHKYEYYFLLYRNIVGKSDRNAVLLSKTYNYMLFSKSLLLDSDIQKDANRMKITWKDVQRQISDEDIAIEFISTIEEEENDYTYHALVLDNNCHSPRMITLYSEKELEEIKNTTTRNIRDIVGEMIWKPILAQYGNVKNIYFSPDGILHILPIEYYNVNTTTNMFEKYNMYRLSSTKELVSEHNHKRFKRAVLYGGLDYNQFKETNSETRKTPSAWRGIEERGGFDPLPNTLVETQKIRDLLERKNISTTLYTGDSGTEESIRELSNNNYSIIHLATHGMYVNPDGVDKKKIEDNFDFLETLADTNDPVKEDAILTHSFLVMAGGNRLVTRNNALDSNNDGILTSKEISQLNLRGLYLVVLSACESALGDIDSGGVYGLQRGFKKAGANTILMSLDKVDDEATQILIVEFYRNLLEGKSKRQSLKDAQKHLRQVENGKYDDPKYWASFILLDGLN